MENSDQDRGSGPACGCGERPCCGRGPWTAIILLIVLVGVAMAVKSLRTNGKASKAALTEPTPSGVMKEPTVVNGAPATPPKEQALPRLVDLGATKCIPCKMMAPILEDLKKTYVGKLDVEFIDVWQDPEPGRKYGIRVIPTQIFFAADGRELFRHEGFYAKEDILAKWKELGVNLPAASQ